MPRAAIRIGIITWSRGPARLTIQVRSRDCGCPTLTDFAGIDQVAALVEDVSEECGYFVLLIEIGRAIEDFGVGRRFIPSCDGRAEVSIRIDGGGGPGGCEGFVDGLR